MGLVAKEPFSDYLRRIYHVEDGENGWVIARRHYDGSIAAVWQEGGMVPPHIYHRYLDVVPGAREDLIESFKTMGHYELPGL